MRCPSGVGAVSRRYGGRNSRRGVRPAKTAQGARKIIRLYVDFVFSYLFFAQYTIHRIFIYPHPFFFFCTFKYQNFQIDLVYLLIYWYWI